MFIKTQEEKKRPISTKGSYHFVQVSPPNPMKSRPAAEIRVAAGVNGTPCVGDHIPEAELEEKRWSSDHRNPKEYEYYPLVNQHSYWTWSFIVDLSIDLPLKNCDFPELC